MDYPYEQLTPDTFQEFCQALLLREYPGFQCLPVRQADAGRDALQQVFRKDFVVFQVKFTQYPEQDGRAWLESVMRDELPKIEALVPKGAKKYVLVTNLHATARGDTGSIDTMQRLMNDLLPSDLLGTCMWREDLNRRLDSAWDLKWSYPALMTGPDFLRAILEHGLAEDVDRRRDAIKAYLAHQEAMDAQVRFKQVDLQKGLLDLFMDVPIGEFDGADIHLEPSHIESTPGISIRDGVGGYMSREDIPSVGAASFLLNAAYCGWS